MNLRNEYKTWAVAALRIQDNTRQQYVTSIDNLSRIVGYDIFENNDIKSISELYEDLLKEQKNLGGKYYENERPSSSLKGWYSASVKTYLDFLKERNNLYNSAIISNTITFKQRQFFESINLTGLKFSVKIITRFISSLLTKPFVICSGLFGSGKTKLAQAFVQWICESNKQYKIVPVGADWTNREPLLGYPNGLNDKEYVMPDSGALQLIIDAKKNESKPYFLILDEMNLSHVERYFADFLSIMESKDGIKLYDGVDRYCNGNKIDKEIYWPKNLFVIGTVNIDETTYMFSPKVLDRANVIEFRITELEMQNYLADVKEIDMDMLLAGAKNGNPGIGASMAVDFLKIAFEKHEAEYDKTILLGFFRELQKAGAEFGYRSASEINELIGVLELLTKGQDNWDGVPIKKENDFIDIAIMQKLLPKLHGSRNKLTPILTALGKLCVANGTNEYLNKDKEFRQAYFEDNKSDNIIYNLSFEKIKRMYHNCNANGFSSYAEA